MEHICYYCRHMYAGAEGYQCWHCGLTDESVSRDNTCNHFEEEV